MRFNWNDPSGYNKASVCMVLVVIALVICLGYFIVGTWTN